MFDLDLASQFPLYTQDYRYRYVSKGTLPLGSLYISEACPIGCNFCASCKTKSGAMMPWSTFTGVLQSPQTVLSDQNPVHLGDGDVFTYRDSGQGKTLLDAVDYIVNMVGRKVHFTTSGIMPQNQDAGFGFLSGLPDVLGKKERRPSDPPHLQLTLSISLLDKWRRANLNEYFARMLDTVRLFHDAGCSITIYNIFSPFDSEGNEQTSRLFRALNSRILSVKNQRISPVGRALTNPGYDNVFVGKVCKNTSCLFIRSDYAHDLEPLFAIRPDGAILLECNGLGNNSTTFGDIFTNDARQVHEAFKAFPAALVQELKEHAYEPRAKCDVHLEWKRNFGIRQQSANPILRRAMC